MVFKDELVSPEFQQLLSGESQAQTPLSLGTAHCEILDFNQVGM